MKPNDGLRYSSFLYGYDSSKSLALTETRKIMRTIEISSNIECLVRNALLTYNILVTR